jgi:aspartyl protease family protein
MPRYQASWFMWKHLVIVMVAVISAIGAARGLMALNSPDGRGGSVAHAEVLTPSDGAHHTPGVAEVSKSPDGHFWAEASVNGSHVRFLVDTGATAVALTSNDAKRLGLHLESTDFDRSVTTASGESRAALVELDYVSVAGARVERVPALVLEKGLETSLLGMTYLGRLSKFEASQTSLILRP